VYATAVNPPPTRPRGCAQCLRADCICPCLVRPGIPVHTSVRLLILQHPREQREPKGSARLLHLAVAGSRLLVGERWPMAPSDDPPPGLPNPQDVLLYPDTPGDAALPAAPAWPGAGGGGPVRLVVLDGTWRKSRRMLYESAWLQGLPRLALQTPPPSRYGIRRARGSGQRSTFEAAVLALAQLDPQGPWSAAWPVFDAFVAQLARRRAVTPR
jgi:DTW domain-containing protein